MKNYPKISIITPSYNQGQYIEQTIRSIIEQNYPNIEYIIIDGGSTDNTVEIIKKYEKHLTYWVSEKDKGQSHAINKGLEHCTGEIFNWINSDDFLEPNSLFEIAEQFNKNPKAKLLCGYCRVFYDKTNETSHIYRMGVHKNISDNLFNPIMCQPSSFYRLETVQKLGGINESLNYVFDDELWFKFLCKYGRKNIIFSNKQLTQFRLHGDSKSVGDGFEKFYLELQTIRYEIGKQLKLKNFLSISIQNEIVTNKYKSGKWDLNKLDLNKFEVELCNRYVYTYYKDFKYDKVNYCLKKIQKHKKSLINLSFIKLWFKMKIIPNILLKELRK